jgi:hypothetical protein
MIPKGYHKHPGCNGLANLPVMENIPTLEEAQTALSQVHCPTCLDLLSDSAGGDRAGILHLIAWAQKRQQYFRRVAHYIQARQQAVMYTGTSWIDDQWGGNLDD